jgi:hypothetical protein
MNIINRIVNLFVDREEIVEIQEEPSMETEYDYFYYPELRNNSPVKNESNNIIYETSDINTDVTIHNTTGQVWTGDV